MQIARSSLALRTPNYEAKLFNAVHDARNAGQELWVVHASPGKPADKTAEVDKQLKE